MAVFGIGDELFSGVTRRRRFCAMGTWMRLIVHLRQVLKIEMRIDLRRSNTGMSQHFLYRTQIAGALQHMGCERMTQLVRMHALRQALALPVFAQNQRKVEDTLAERTLYQQVLQGAAPCTPTARSPVAAKPRLSAQGMPR